MSFFTEMQQKGKTINPFCGLKIKPDYVDGGTAYFSLKKNYMLCAKISPRGLFSLDLVKKKEHYSRKIMAHQSISNGFGLPNKDFYEMRELDMFLQKYYERIKK